MSGCVALGASMLGCSGGPAYMTLGEHESYCEDHADCDPGLFCLQVEGAALCTPACASDADCGDSYSCSRTEGICRPAPSGMCRDVDERCGPGFPPCCEGSRCVMFLPFGAYCTTHCVDGSDCSSGCCASAGSGEVCAPPTFC
jgi:hypothetical protein